MSQQRAPAEAAPGNGQMAEKPGLARDPWFRMGLVILIALAPRLIYLFQIEEWQFFHWPVLDSRVQWKWGAILLQTHLIGNQEVLAKAPLYSYYLAFVNWLMGERQTGLFAAHLLQLVTGAVTCGLTYLLGRRVFGEAVGLIAGLMLAVYSPGIYRDGQLLDTALATFLATSFLLLLLLALDQPSRGKWLASGLVLGLLALTRPNLLFLGLVSLVLMIVWLRRSQGPAVWVLAGVFVLGVVLPIIPITGRNYLIVRHFVPISLTGGVNLWTGNNPEADGYSPVPSGIAWERTWYEAKASGAIGPVEMDVYWQKKATRFLREQPGLALKLLFRKMYLYWNAYEIPNNVSYDWGREHSSLLRALPLTFAVVGPLGLLGLALGGWRSRSACVVAIFVLVQMVTVAIFFVTGRYRMPALPALCVLAGFAVVEVPRLVGRRRFGTVLLSLLGLLVFGALVNSDIYGIRVNNPANRDWYYLGQSYLMGGDMQRAKEAFRRGTEQHRDDADAYRLLGETEMQLGDPAAAGRDLRKALEIAPDFTAAATGLGALALKEAWPLEEPERLLREAIKRQPGKVEGVAMLVRLSVARGDMEQARADLEALEAGVRQLALSDTRTAATLEEARRAVAEAQEAGVELPPGLRPPAGSGRGSGGY